MKGSTGRIPLGSMRENEIPPDSTFSYVLNLHLILDLNFILILNVVRKSSLLKLCNLIFT